MRGVSDAAVLGFGFRDPKNFYYLGLFFLFAVFVSWRLAASRIGRAWTAMREDEQIADAMGVSTTRYKLLAFAIGGAIGSVGGALFAVKIGSLTPASFGVFVSIQVLGIVILGGIGSLPGVVVGSLVLVGLPGLLREFEEYRLLAYGAAIVAVMILRPQGLWPNVRRSRELLGKPLRTSGRAGSPRTSTRARFHPRGRALDELASWRSRGVEVFRRTAALDELQFEVHEGEIVSLIGPNGAGKSTVFNMITGLYTPDEGDIGITGNRSWGCGPTRSCGSGSHGRSRT